MKLSAILADRRTLEIAVGEDVLTVVYAPSAVTPRTISLALDEGDDLEVQGIVYMLAQILDSWDLTDDDGDPVAIETDVLMGLPVRFLSQVMRAINADTGGDPTNSGSSAATLPRKGRSEKSRNGTR